MKDIDMKIIQLRDQTWQIARDSLDKGETRIYRTLTDIAEKLTNLISSSDKSQIDIINKGKMIPIFARYKGEKYEAELDVDKIDESRARCVLIEGKWRTTSRSAMDIKKNSINPPKNPETDGWKDFWKYIDESSNTEQPIDKLRGTN